MKQIKKIGIVTIHRICNYGALLQAYALNKYLRNVGYDVETIDFRTYRVAESYKLFAPLRHYIKHLPKLFFTLWYLPKAKRKNRNFLNFINQYIPQSQQTFYSNQELEKAQFDYDCYVCGSDQIWHTFCQNYSDAFILKFAKDKGRRISYAASMGTPTIHQSKREIFREELSDFYALSVRETSAKDEIEKLTGRDVQHVVDPVYLLSADEWLELSAPINIKQPYIFFYFVHGDLPGMRKFVKELSRVKKMPVVVVNRCMRELLYPNIKMYDAGPREFVSLVANAEYVCTNSFHAASFSIIFNKKFIVFTEKVSPRLQSLLSTFGFKNRIATQESRIDVIDEDIDYKRVNQLVGDMTKASKEFLSNSLK